MVFKKYDNWNDFWQDFDELCRVLEENGKSDVVEQIKHAQKYVNGLTDGWHDFLDQFEETKNTNLSRLNKEEVARFEWLGTYLLEILHNR